MHVDKSVCNTFSIQDICVFMAFLQFQFRTFICCFNSKKTDTQIPDREFNVNISIITSSIKGYVENYIYVSILDILTPE